jgi:ubiquinone/menaquinone biosynthesis C-methylase UbiE
MAHRSMVEISGHWAPYYDHLMDLLFLGFYPRFMAEVTAVMQIQPEDEILDLGSGTGRNACLMADKLGSAARVVGVDISPRMLRHARRRCNPYPQITFRELRIEEPLPFAEEFDSVFISFALHGFEDEDKRRIFANARKALRQNGSLWILDYNEFDLEQMYWPLQWLFTHLECELASEFLTLNLARMLAENGFEHFVSHEFLRGYVRLIEAQKPGNERSN